MILPSVSTADDMRAQYDLPPDKLEVVPLGVDPAFRPTQDEDAARAVRPVLGGDRPYRSRRRKAVTATECIPLLIEAFADAKKRLALPHYLLFFGPNHLRLPLERLAARARRFRRRRAGGREVSSDTGLASSTTAPTSSQRLVLRRLLAAARRGSRLRNTERDVDPRRSRGDRGRRGAARRRAHVESRRRDRTKASATSRRGASCARGAERAAAFSWREMRRAGRSRSSRGSREVAA